MIILFGRVTWNWNKSIRLLENRDKKRNGNNDRDLIKIEWLKELSDHQLDDVEVIVPLCLEDMYFCNSSDLFLNRWVVCCRNSETIRLMDNKFEFISWIKAHDLAEYVPEMFLSKVDGVVSKYSEVVFPAIYKKIHCSSARDSIVLKTQQDLDRVLKTDDLVIQKYIRHPEEYSGHFYLDFDGVIRFNVIFKSHPRSGKFITKGALKKYSVVTDLVLPIVLPVFSKIFSQLRYTALCFLFISFQICYFWKQF